MKKIWVQVLQGLRAAKEYSLFALVSSLDEVQFTDTQIILPPHNTTEAAVLKRNLGLLNQLAGGDYIVLADNLVTEPEHNGEYVARLRELFGDKVEIV